MAPREEPEDDYLTSDEIIDAIGRLSVEDRTKLAGIEARRRGGTRFGPGELLQEAIRRTREGRRNCRRNVPIMAFLSQTIRNIAHHARHNASAAEVLVDFQEPESLEVLRDGIQPSPEDELIENECVDVVLKHFEDDGEAQMVIMGWLDDLRGGALREATGLDQAQLDYAIKRIRRKMNRLYPNGWHQ